MNELVNNMFVDICKEINGKEKKKNMFVDTGKESEK